MRPVKKMMFRVKKRMFGVEKKILRVAFRVEKDASPTANGRTDSC